MAFSDQIITDLDQVFYNTDEFAEAATYTPRVGSPSAVTVIRNDQDATLNPEAPGDRAEIRIRTSELTIPNVGDRITMGGETWQVIEIIGGGPRENEWFLGLTRSERRLL